MDRFIPQADYAEDQPMSRLVLYTHTMHRGFTMGGFIGALVGVARVSKLWYTTKAQSSATVTKSLLTSRVLGSSAIGSLCGVGTLAVMTYAQMWGREQIEWQDRSWRLLHNRGQNRADRWSVVASAASAAAVLATRSTGIAQSPWKALLGTAALASLGATIAASQVPKSTANEN
ncbi:uncharacterized protein V1510DRAFT_406655 [Dipodascopsis tothii]|uniref:uncharacterized protein n=1 Tax=Dipodascopsis tothii TaxID=44089 RepID=UPI0034CDA37C